MEDPRGTPCSRCRTRVRRMGYSYCRQCATEYMRARYKYRPRKWRSAAELNAERPYKCRKCGGHAARVWTDSRGHVWRRCRPCYAAVGKASRLRRHAYELERGKQWRLRNAARIAAKNARENRALRAELLAAYGHVCSCCGETAEAFLTVDHINGGGRQHRKQVRGGLYKWLKNVGFPKDEYRLLCFNCNCVRGTRGYCPHENRRAIKCA